jgi:hypothetical protein
LLPSLLYTFLVGFSYYLFLICLFSIIFNYQVHKKYANYVSLFLAILTAILLILYLVLKFEQFYVLYF